MSNETKREVFGQLLNAYQNLIMKDIEIPEGNYRENIITPWNVVYDDALPDDMPVIPKEIGEYIQWGKKYDIQPYMLYYCQLIHRPGFKKLTDDAISWMITYQNTFALAWVLGIWRIEETGEIVKLEEIDDGD